MTTQVQDAKAGDQPGEVSSNSQLDPEHFDPDSENLIDTVEDIGGIDESTGGTRKPETKGSEDAAQGTDTKTGIDEKPSGEDEKPSAVKADDKEVPDEFHKHPAWQRIIQERDSAKSTADALIKRVEALEIAKPQDTEGKAETPKLIDIGNLTTEELLEWQNDDPKGYMQNFLSVATQNISKTLRDEFAQKSQEKKTNETFDTYAKDNPTDKSGTGFMQMWDDGQLRAFMDTHPGHNAISAHMALTADNRINSAVEEAVAKTKKEMAKQQQARVVTDGLGGAPGYSLSSEDQGLKDTRKRGGKISVLADRLLKRRQQQQ